MSAFSTAFSYSRIAGKPLGKMMVPYDGWRGEVKRIEFPVTSVSRGGKAWLAIVLDFEGELL